MADNSTSPGNVYDIVIVGAGIGGLVTAITLKNDGHKVLVLEEATAFGEVGAGMRIPPNCFKLLHSLGIDFSHMRKTHSNGNRFLRYSDGAVLAHMSHGVPELAFGGSYLMVHRADYHALLLEKAFAAGVEILKAKKVVEYDWEKPAVRTADGSCYDADLIVVADGVQSEARAQILGHELPPQDTGDIAYRILIPGHVLMRDPELRDLVSQPWVTSWCGPDAHFIGYPVRGGEIYNIVACCASETVNDAKLQGIDSKVFVENNQELLRRFGDWEPRILKLCHLAGQTKFLKWRLYDLDLVDRWVHPSGKACLLGDACHPMLPYMSQGAAQATEDAFVLTASLRRNKQNLRDALDEYQRIRQPRVSRIQKAGRLLQTAYHLPDGDEQMRRDELISKDGDENPIFWGSSERREWLFGYDAQQA